MHSIINNGYKYDVYRCPVGYTGERCQDRQDEFDFSKIDGNVRSLAGFCMLIIIYAQHFKNFVIIFLFVKHLSMSEYSCVWLLV